MKVLSIKEGFMPEFTAELTKDEAEQEQATMQAVSKAAMSTAWGGNPRALHDLKYKRDLVIDGRTFANAWCRNLQQNDDNVFVATYCFDGPKLSFGE